jgi:hypothetical protein
MVLKAATLYADPEMAVEMCAFVHVKKAGRKEVEVING